MSGIVAEDGTASPQLSGLARRKRELERVFEGQVATWVAAAPVLDLGVPAREIEEAFAPLLETLCGLGPAPAGVAPPFALVLPEADPVRLVTALRLEDRNEPGVLDPNHGPEGLARYRPIEQVEAPKRAYALVGIERGDDFRGVAPRVAISTVFEQGRSPLTIVEGLALVLVCPRILERNYCFSLAGSRRGDKRVPALWISAGAPKLGWCWEGNPHDWLGFASVARRVTGR